MIQRYKYNPNSENVALHVFQTKAQDKILYDREVSKPDCLSSGFTSLLFYACKFAKLLL